MATTTQSRPGSRSVRERLLDAAEELFYADGIASTGVDAVVERAGVATGSLYKNFGGKDGLVEAYLAGRDQRWRAHWEACIAEQDDPVERVLALFTVATRWSTRAATGKGCAHLAAVVQLPPGHRSLGPARAHRQYLADRLGELCAATGDEDPTGLRDDLLLLHEGMNGALALGGPDPVHRALRLARARLDSGS